MGVRNFSSTEVYANRLDLDKLPVFLERSGTDPMFLEVSGIPEILTYGKHYITVSFKDSSNSQYYLRNGSKLSFEVKDSDGNIVFSEIADSDEILTDYQGASIIYIWVKEDPLRTYQDIANGMGTLTFVGELTGVPTEWQNKPNYRCTFPIEIRKELPNTSPILFQSASLVQSTFTNTTTAAYHLSTTSSLSESVQLDKGDLNYKRSYLHISASRLGTFGGKVEFVEVAYNENTSFDNEFKNLSTFPLTGSISSSDCTFETSASAGLNPVSIVQSFRLPRDLRRETNTDFRLRFLNSDMQYVQNLNENKIIEITSSLMITGSPVILETNDNLITGSGKLIFGKTVDEGIKLEYIDSDKSLKMTHFDGGKEIQVLQEIRGTKGGVQLGGAVGTQRIEGIASGSAILAGSGSTVNSAIGSTIAGGLNNQIKDSKRSTIVGGADNRITASMYGSTIYGHDCVIVGGGDNELSGSERSFIGGGEENMVLESNSTTIVAGHRNIITDNGRSFIGGGQDNQMSGTSAPTAYNWNVIVGGKNNRLGVLTGTDYQYGFIGGGGSHTLQASYASILGGQQNNCVAYLGSIMGGRMNSMWNSYYFMLGADFIGTGYDNHIGEGTSGFSSYYGSHVIVGGYQNTIDGLVPGYEHNNCFIGTGTTNTLQAAPYSVIMNGLSNAIWGPNATTALGAPSYCFIGTGVSNTIQGLSSGSSVIGGSHNLISQSRDTHVLGSHITVKSSSAHNQPDTTYVNNLIVSGGSNHPIAGTGLFTGDVTILGSLHATQITSSIISSSILYSSGSNIFGDAATDSHKFNGHITASGNIKSSGIIYGKLNSTDTSTDSNHYIQMTEDNGADELNHTNGFVFNPSTDTLILGDSKVLLTGTGGHITASGNISASGTITADSASLSGRIHVAGKSLFGGTNSQGSHHFKGVAGDTNFFIIFDKDGEEVMKGVGAVGDGNLTYAFGDNAGAGQGTTLKLDENNSVFHLTNDSKNAKVGINQSQDATSIPKELTLKGSISASGDVIATNISASNFYLTASAAGGVTVDMGIHGNDGIAKWAFHRNNVRKHILYLEGRDDAGVPQDSLVFKHGLIGDGDDHINFHTEQDDQTVYFHGGISSSGAIHSETHITASGNISSSGHIYGDKFFSNGVKVARYRTDLNIIRYGKELYPSMVTGSYLRFGDDAGFHVTASGDISSSITSTGSFGNIIVGHTIHRAADPDTRILFTDDDINIQVGGMNMVDFTEAGSDEITFNEGAADLDVRIEGESDANLLFTNAGTDRVGVGTNSPSSKLEVNGDITAIHITSSGNTVLGNHGSDSHKINGTTSFAGHITASGNISGSSTSNLSMGGDFIIAGVTEPYLSASLGNLTLSGSDKGQLEVDYRLFDTSSINTTTYSAGAGVGDIVKFGGTGTTKGKIYYLKIDGTWGETDADEGYSSGSLAVALGSNSDHGMLLRGVAALSSDVGGDIGNPVYLSTTAGQATTTAPGSGDFARVIGHKISGSVGVYFNPDSTTIKVA